QPTDTGQSEADGSADRANLKFRHRPKPTIDQPTRVGTNKSEPLYKICVCRGKFGRVTHRGERGWQDCASSGNEVYPHACAGLHSFALCCHRAVAHASDGPNVSWLV